MTGFVVFAERDLTQVASIPVAEIAGRLANRPARDGDYGPYWWLDEAGNPTGSGYGSGSSFCDPF